MTTIKEFLEKLNSGEPHYVGIVYPYFYDILTTPHVRKVPHEREQCTVRNADGSIRHQTEWYEDCERDTMPYEVDRIVDMNYAAPGTWDVIPSELDDHLVSYEYHPWVTTLQTDTRHESYRDCYAISNGIRAWIGRIEHICEVES